MRSYGTGRPRAISLKVLADVMEGLMQLRNVVTL